MIIGGALDEATEDVLGARLGVSARHLRRMFHEHLGVTPDQFARSRRAHFARRLLDDSDLPIADIAFASGFGSLRQFNRAMRDIFRSAPSELRDRRRRTDRLAADGGLVLRLPFTPPYDWDATLTLLARTATPGVESIENRTYRRTITLDGSPGMLEIGEGGADHLLLRAHLPYWEGVIHVVARAATLVGVDVDPVRARTQLATDPILGPLIAARPGVRVPGAWTPFEAAVQASGYADVATTHGVLVPGLGHGLTYLFPSAEAIGELPPPTDTAAAHLAMRLGDWDAFPAGDPAVATAVRDLGADPERWRPWRSLATAHLLLRG
jgi:AraC family transcriptional regulator of adaptative response / DNA-3-methyladenine glycosylase II